MVGENLDRFFNPKSVAVVGASNDSKKVGNGVFRNLLVNKKIKVFPVNKNRKTVLGKKAYSQVDLIDEKVDLVIIATPAFTVLEILKDCVRKKVGGVVILSSGFDEIGSEGKKLSEEILKIAKENNIRILGPNCMGFITPTLNASFSKVSPFAGSVAFVSQSGALGSAVLDWMKEKNVGLSFFSSIGSMIDIGFEEMVEYLGNDSSTKSIVFYMESLNNSRKFLEVCRRVGRKKPLVVLKAGRSSQGAEASKSHTGSIVGNDAVFDVAMKSAGIIRVENSEDLFDLIRFLDKSKKVFGKGLAIVTNAGGPGVLSTDFLISRGGELSKLSRDSIEKLNKILPKNWSHSNPVDVLGDADENYYREAVKVCLNDKNVDAVLVLVTPQIMTNAKNIASEILKIKTSKVILASFIGGKNIEEGKKILEKSGVFYFDYPEQAIKSYVYLSSYFEKKDFGSGKKISGFNKDETSKIFNSAFDEGRFVLDEIEAKKVFENYKIPIIESYLAKSATEAINFSRKVGYPVALKISSKDILHRTDVGGVKLNLKNDSEVKTAYSEILSAVSRKNKNAKIDGVIVSSMTSKKFQLIFGSKRDEIFGPTVVFGFGGTAVNIFNDVKIGLAPLSFDEAKNLISQTKVYRLLEGYRGEKGVDLNKLALILQNFSYLVWDFPIIKEVDVNPFCVDEKGGFAVDVKIILDENFVK